MLVYHKYLLVGEVRTLRQIRARRTRPFWVLDADDEATLGLYSEVFLYLTNIGGNRDSINKMCGTVFRTSNEVHAFGNCRDWLCASCAHSLGLVLIPSEEVFFELLHSNVRLLDECHETVAVTLGEDLLWQCKETVVFEVWQ